MFFWPVLLTAAGTKRCKGLAKGKEIEAPDIDSVDAAEWM